MKRLIAFILICSTNFSTFTWNFDFLKPNYSSWHQSWTNLPSNQQNMLIGASTVATLTLLYAGWPVSQASAKSKALAEAAKRKPIVENAFKGKTNKLADSETVQPIVNNFKLERFPYGSLFNRNRPEYRVYTQHFTLPASTLSSKDATNHVMITVTNSANTTHKEEFYRPNVKKWEKRLDNLD